MTNYEFLKSVPVEKLAKALCELMQESEVNGSVEDICKICPAEHYCKPGHNGFIDWLKEEKKP